MREIKREKTLAYPPVMQASWILGPLTPADPVLLGVSVAAWDAIWNLWQKSRVAATK